MSQVIHTRTTIQEGGKLVMDRLPFHAGQTVEVTVAEEERPALAETAGRYPLRGTVLRYDDPFKPACPPEDWDALR